MNEPDPISQHLKKAALQADEERAAASGEALFTSEAVSAVKARAPKEFKALEEHLKERVCRINADPEKHNRTPELRYVDVYHRLEERDSPKLALAFTPMPGVSHYTLRVRIGSHPAVLEIAVPLLGRLDVRETIWNLRAIMNEQGEFWWEDLRTKERLTTEQLVDRALNEFADLIVEHHLK